ncbi:Alanine--tRNA ligase, organellar chromatophore [Photorhabdus australis subsp. thailandensis]|uniref:Alanine--tRNA ligase, organellar chromatophore n=2 Tax=Photorhabdus australis TaxID=286156 RepID=A0A1C0U8J9_9GAMM|nr:Alanine--tRNA ligase, organellar chromatophore [Photorhabdus australis subsp. thailandensis]
MDMNINELLTAEASFMLGTLTLESNIIGVMRYEDGILLITQDSPFYPKNYKWPDQLHDNGIISIGDKELAVTKVYTAGLFNDHLYIDQEITKQATSPEKIIPVHYIPDLQEFSERDLIGKTVTLSVNYETRYRVSAAHSMAHFMSLALNKATNHIWSKVYDTDDLGNYNLDKAAIYQSSITELKSVDIYRFGKSLKKKGFDKNILIENLDKINREVNSTLNNWLTQGAEITVEYKSKEISDTRLWKSTIDSTVVTIPCGGTHINNINEVKEVNVEIKIGESIDFIQVITHCRI